MTGRTIPTAAWRFVEQQSQELSLRQSQQEQPGEQEQEQRFSGHFLCVEYSSVSELANGNSSGV